MLRRSWLVQRQQASAADDAEDGGTLESFAASLDVPAGVELRGTFTSVPSHDVRDGIELHDGTVLVPLGEAGVQFRNL